MEFPDDLRYTTRDEWLRLGDDGADAVVGVTDYAQDRLGDVVFVDLPEVGRAVKQGESFGIIESVKAVSDLYSPVSGEITAHNEALTESPELVNASPYGDGWMVRIRLSDRAEVDALLTAAQYRDQLPQG